MQALQRWQGAWQTTRDDVCAQARTGVAVCLDEARARFDALVEVLEHAPLTNLRRAMRAISALPAPNRCDSAVLPSSPASPVVGLSQALLASARALADTRQDVASRAHLDAARAVAPVAAQGLLAEIAVLDSVLALRNGRADDALELARRGVELATAAGDDERAAQAATRVMRLLLEQFHDLQGATLWSGHAKAAVARSGSAALARQLAFDLGDLEFERGDWALAISLQSTALAQAREQGVEPATLAGFELDLGRTYTKMGRHDEARPLLERALAEKTERLGPSHPELSGALSTLGATLDEMREYDAANLVFSRQLEITRRVAPNSTDLAVAHNNLGVNAMLREDYPEAREHLQEAMTSWAAVGNAADHATAMLNLGSVEHSLGNYVRALELHQQTEAVLARIRGGDHIEVQRARRAVARQLNALGRTDEAIATLESVLPQLRILGADSELGYALVELAQGLWSRARGADRAYAHVFAFEAAARFVQVGMPEPVARQWLVEHPL